MMVSVSANLAFLAVPRAASSSIETELSHLFDISYRKPPKAKHMNYMTFSRKILPHLSSFGIEKIETVAVFREPLDWLHSWYCYLKNLPIGAEHSNHNVDFSDAEIDFNRFTEAYLQTNPPAFAHVGQQSRFVANKDGHCGIDHLFRFTNIIGLQQFLAKRFKRELLFLPSNISPRTGIDLSPDLRRELISKFTLDYDIYESVAR